ncbi:MAG: hypothetical protein IMX00_01725 [Limnochordales bacterium]|nr:hypothetical protein [Limnochordales bacterium]
MQTPGVAGRGELDVKLLQLLRVNRSRLLAEIALQTGVAVRPLHQATQFARVGPSWGQPSFSPV